MAANLVGVERSEAEAIYDSGREACVAFLIRLEGRLRALEEENRQLKHIVAE